MARNFRRRESRSTFGFRPIRFKSQQTGGGFPSVISQGPASILITTPVPIEVEAGLTSQLSWVFLDNQGVEMVGTQRIVAWTSSATTTATVASTTGVVTGVATGQAIMTVASAADNISSSATVFVLPASVGSIDIITGNVSVPSSVTFLVSAYVYSSANTIMSNATLTWSSSSTYVFTVGSDITTADPLHQVVVTAKTLTSTSSATITATA